MRDIKFKVGDWVKHDNHGICIVDGLDVVIHEGEERLELTINKCYSKNIKVLKYVYSYEVKKLYPKFDKFDDLFSEKPESKFKVGDKVFINIDSEAIIDKITSLEGELVYIIDKCIYTENSLTLLERI